MGLNQLFDKNLVFCLQSDNQEHLFNQVANLLEERKIVTPSYRTALIEREKSFPTGLDMEFLGDVYKRQMESRRSRAQT